MAVINTAGLEMYKFILEAIRVEDSKTGLFLQRFLQGPQDVWVQIEERMFEFLNLWDALNVEDEYLQYLKLQVGWTPDLNHITNAVSYDSLRKLIINAVDIWKFRGTGDSIEDIVRFSVGGRNKLFTWFDYRVLLDENSLGSDVYMNDSIDDTEVGDSEYSMVFKLADDGSIDHILVRDLCQLMRPLGEAIYVIYHLFLDYFQIDGDSSQWSLSPNYNGTITVADGEMSIGEGSACLVYIDVSDSETWSSYSYSLDMKVPVPGPGQRTDLVFYHTGVDLSESDINNKKYQILINTASQEAWLDSYTGATGNSKAHVYFSDLGFYLYTDIFYNYRIETIEEGSGLRIRFYIDQIEVFNFLDTAPHTEGTCGVLNMNALSSYIKNVEIRQLPTEIDIIS